MVRQGVLYPEELEELRNAYTEMMDRQRLRRTLHAGGAAAEVWNQRPIRGKFRGRDLC